jgi:hypothetical protein
MTLPLLVRAIPTGAQYVTQNWMKKSQHMAFACLAQEKIAFSPATLLSFGPSVCSGCYKAQQQTGAPA